MHIETIPESSTLKLKMEDDTEECVRIEVATLTVEIDNRGDIFIFSDGECKMVASMGDLLI